MKLIYLKSPEKSNSFDISVSIEIPFFRVLFAIEPGRSLLQFVTTNCLTKADKMNSFVVMNTTHYDNKILSHLNDTITYKTITHNPTDQFANNIINELKQLKQNGKIIPQLYYKFFPRVSFCPKLYGLPKIHKQGIPLRPIVACSKASVANIGKWLCTAFKLLLYSQNSYIRNSADLVEKLSSTSISENTLVSSFDIVSMYTNIDVTISEELLKNKLEENYHLIEASATDLIVKF